MSWEKLIKSNLGAIRSEALDKIIAADKKKNLQSNKTKNCS